MGFSVKFNWVLQMEVTETLQVGKLYSFKKPGNRIFPIDAAIDLIDPNRNAIAKIKVKRFTNENSVTFGEFEVLKVYDGEEQIVLNQYWRENE
jgi:hypothetical protein